MSQKLVEALEYYRDADARLLAGQEEVDRKAPLLTEQGGNDFIYSWDVSKLKMTIYTMFAFKVFVRETVKMWSILRLRYRVLLIINPSSFGAPQPSDGSYIFRR
jgi:hypothetical protein